MNRYVLDTNTIISAHLLPVSVSRKAFDKATQKGVVLYSAESLSELVQAFFRPKFDKYTSVEGRQKAIDACERRGFRIDVNVKPDACRDYKDNKFPELAVAGDGFLMVSGDRDLLVLRSYHNIPIGSPGDYLKN
jgi:uncharacterized protein